MCQCHCWRFSVDIWVSWAPVRRLKHLQSLPFALHMVFLRENSVGERDWVTELVLHVRVSLCALFTDSEYIDATKFLQKTRLGVGKLQYLGVMQISGAKHIETLQMSSHENAGRWCTVTVVSDLCRAVVVWLAGGFIYFFLNHGQVVPPNPPTSTKQIGLPRGTRQ